MQQDAGQMMSAGMKPEDLAVQHVGKAGERMPVESSQDYTSMQDSISQQIRVWLPTQPIVIGEWGSESAQATANRAAHALAYSQDVTTAGMVPVWWDNGSCPPSSTERLALRLKQASSRASRRV